VRRSAPSISGEPRGLAPAPLRRAAGKRYGQEVSKPLAMLRAGAPPALSIPAFRWYWLAQWPALLGNWMQLVALGFLVFQLTHSAGAVAIVAAADGIPGAVLSLPGGVLADRISRRRILLCTQSVLAITSGLLAALVATGHAGLPAIAALAVMFGAADAFDLPARQAMVADLVGIELLPGALALASVAMSTTRIAGPALAGLIIATGGAAACFVALAVSYAVVIVVLWLGVPDTRAPRRAPRHPLRELGDALLEAKRDVTVRTLLFMIGIISLLSLSFMPYLPVLVSSVLHGDSRLLGLAYSVGGLGGLAGGLVIAARSRRRLPVGVLRAAVVVYTAALFTVNRSSLVGLTLPSLALISLCFVTINTFLTSTLQAESDAAMRGRLLGLYTMMIVGLQPLGSLLYGAMGSRWGLFNVMSVGALITGAGLLLASTPLERSLRRTRSPQPETPG
jgi:predicted MFS family arabinose efflux permease